MQHVADPSTQQHITAPHQHSACADHAVHALQGEFEAGFEQGGQTREHAHLAKTLGVTKLVVAINKMDDPSILPEDGVWPQSRYDEIEKGLTPFLRSCG